MSTDLINQLSEIRTKLNERKATLLAEVAQIDKALSGSVPAPAKPAKAPSAANAAPKPGGIADAIIAVLAGSPRLTAREIQAALPEHKAKTVEVTVHQMASSGRLAKDDGNPRRFSLPEKSTAGGELPGGSSHIKGAAQNNGAARPQQAAAGKP